MAKPTVPDMNAQEFSAAARQVVERIAAFLENPERWRVLPAIAPGEIRASLPTAPPAQGESFDQILADFDRLIMPATTHWNHPGFMAYFATSGSGPGILAEALIAMLNVNAMLWRTGPAQTELEEVTLGWLRQMIGLPAEFDGTINDTASTSTLYALAAAREYQPDLDVRERGLSGMPQLRVYCSEQAHSSVDKAALTLGLGKTGIRHIPTDDVFRMDAGALRSAIAEDRAQGIRPIAVIATVGTTSTTSMDPVPEIADICEQEKIWLHVDAAYAGTAAIIPELRSVLRGCERAQSLVINPHKWMFTPMDCSVLYTTRPDVLRKAFSLVPDYLQTAEGQSARNLMDYGVALGRRFRALKLWFIIRYFGTERIAEVLRHHIALARKFEQWVKDDADFELLAPRNFSVVVFRYRPSGKTEEDVDALNERILDAVNASGEIFISHTRLRGRYALRLAIGNLRTSEQHVQRAWQLIRGHSKSLVAGK